MIKIIELTAFSLTKTKSNYYCQICRQKVFKIIFQDKSDKKYYCNTCLIKELNKF